MQKIKKNEFLNTKKSSDSATNKDFLNRFSHLQELLKNIKDVAQDLKEDLIFAERVEKAWQDYDKGKFVTKSKDNFLKELRAC